MSAPTPHVDYPPVLICPACECYAVLGEPVEWSEPDLVELAASSGVLVQLSPAAYRLDPCGDEVPGEQIMVYRWVDPDEGDNDAVQH